MAAAANAGTTRLFVGAIDFGTTYSGYAFASVADLKKDTGKINANVWNSGTFMSSKTPTCLLLTHKKTLHSFGYEAENKYTELTATGEHKNWYYFQRFKMLLHHNKSLHRNTVVKDITGKKEMCAKDVFSFSIQYLKTHMYQTIKASVADLAPSDILYVLTVPAIWDDSAKQFMREAAEQAGITRDQLMVALEPEAASIFCRKLPSERKTVDGATTLTSAGEGSQYMIADLGGGTADITVHQRLKNDKIKEVHRASGGNWGGKSVDDAFLKFLDELCEDEEVMEEFKDESMEDYIELLREFETKKRETGETKIKVSLSFPVALKTILEKKRGLKMEEIIKQCKYKTSLSWTRSQKLQIHRETFVSFYENTVGSIVEQIAEIITNIKVGGVDTILLVGGFSECTLILEALKQHEVTKKNRFIIPDECGLAVVKGAVLFGFMPDTVFARVARKTYGIQSWPIFREGEHPRLKKVIIDGVARCKDVFFKYVEIGQEVNTGHRMSQVFQALHVDEGALECTVYVSDDTDPKYVTDPSCRMLGVLNIPIPKGKASRCEIEETLIFGDTELKVHARELATGNSVEYRFDLM